MTIQFFASGYCEAHERIVDPKNGQGKCSFYAVWALIDIPQIGFILFDTGYSPEFFEATQSFPERFYRWATPMVLKHEESAVQILQQKGIQADEIKFIIVSHFHADHIAGLKDFPNAQFICSKHSYDEVKLVSGIKAVSKGILQRLLPNDFESRLLFIEAIVDKTIENQFGLKEYWFWGLKELQLVSLPGHARGMLGFIFRTDSFHLVYATDASWRYDTYVKGILPKKVVKLFLDSWDDFVATQKKLQFYEKHNNATVLFTHCPETLNYLNYVFQG